MEPSSGSKRTVRDWDLVEFQPDPDSQFWLPHLGRARLQELPKQPWESSPINKVFDMSFLQPPKYPVVGFADALMGVTANPAMPTLPSSSSSPPQFIAEALEVCIFSSRRGRREKEVLAEAAIHNSFGPSSYATWVIVGGCGWCPSHGGGSRAVIQGRIRS